SFCSLPTTIGASTLSKNRTTVLPPVASKHYAHWSQSSKHWQLVGQPRVHASWKPRRARSSRSHSSISRFGQNIEPDLLGARTSSVGRWSCANPTPLHPTPRTSLPPRLLHPATPSMPLQPNPAGCSRPLVPSPGSDARSERAHRCLVARP